MKWTCKKCGAVAVVPDGATITCHCAGEIARKWYLGDVVAWLLHRIGIKPTGNCNCDSRRKWLNQFDRKVRSLFH